MLDDRKLKVLKAIINSYIVSAEPIGSRTISKEYDLGVSSATIRNEMSDLEDLGYLNKPHTSAGRIPSDKAYRLYVDHLIEVDGDKADGRYVNLLKVLRDENSGQDEIMVNSLNLLSKFTSYTTLAISPQVKREKLKHIQLISLDSREILIVLVTETGKIKNTILRTDREVGQDKLNAISNFLNVNLKGLTMEDINPILENEIVENITEHSDLIRELIPLVNRCLDSTENVKLYTTGINQIFNYPEFNNIEKARSFISFIEDKDMLLNLLLDSSFNSGIDISIGQENTLDPLKESSLLTATYRQGDKTIGKIGVIGPTRMDYFTVINALDIISVTLSDILSEE